MRISDWSSDVCSSDLQVPAFVALVHCRKHTADAAPDFENAGIPGLAQSIERPCILDVFQPVESLERESSKLPEHERVIERAPVFGLSDRKSVVWGKSVSVRVDLGGRRIIKKKRHS